MSLPHCWPRMASAACLALASPPCVTYRLPQMTCCQAKSWLTDRTELNLAFLACTLQRDVNTGTLTQHLYLAIHNLGTEPPTSSYTVQPMHNILTIIRDFGIVTTITRPSWPPQYQQYGRLRMVATLGHHSSIYRRACVRMSNLSKNVLIAIGMQCMASWHQHSSRVDRPCICRHQHLLPGL